MTKFKLYKKGFDIEEIRKIKSTKNGKSLSAGLKKKKRSF